MRNCFIIAIDGVASSGKGTLAKKLANHFGFEHLDTGLLYRETALTIIQNNIDISNLSLLLEHIKSIPFHSEKVPELFTEEVGRIASQIATIPAVRQMLNEIQHNFPKNKKGVVIDGRDIGTIIFPNADLKFFVTASVEVRAQRRFNQLQNLGKSVIFDEVLRDLRERDDRDIHRKVAPTVAANDAIIIDTTRLDANSVLELVISLSQKAVNQKLVA